MKKIFLFFLISVALLLPTPVLASEQRVYDDAGLLTTETIAELEEKIQSVKEDYDIDIVCVTTNDAKSKTSLTYAEDYLDQGYFTGEFSNDAILFLIDMDNRHIAATYAGKAITYFNYDRQQKLENDAYNEISKQDYGATFFAYINGAEKYLREENPTMMDRVKRVAMRTVIIAPIAIIAGYIMMKIKTKKGRNFESRSKYQRPLDYEVQYAVNTEVLAHSNTTKVYIPPRSTSSSSGSRGSSRSSSGRTHSGSSRKF